MLKYSKITVRIENRFVNLILLGSYKIQNETVSSSQCRLKFLSDLYVQLCILSHLGRATPSNFNYVNQQTDDESEPLLSDTSDINLQRHGYSGQTRFLCLR